ncbi:MULTISPECIES: hypothetical protein [unclassified Pseudomonas]|uniref:hypothetical protein n=1 Tax=unclassified Pseudomonas TaxID=196821 RepID=UPI002AC92715|nr:MULTISPECIES: hypothetical protein [unclassified Pseudomonas]MEB0041540.1 hypothetical protein [Pseudomonas sp. MH10]MEB0075972.1 hypothetical protein [Pseudomonas sp. MH10out]MEB0093682.1 hypothetical protein [Pseudomonas sp. CCI4.2]MEB0101417.1 hypothetical protein [Pseudomonas sp. CCI3.2]MEB0122566.1 hypothetical protein [Pseudomonas sp. CCI1.2]
MSNVVSFPDAHERDRLKSNDHPGLLYLSSKERLLIEALRVTSHAGRQYIYEYAHIMQASKPLHPD